MPAVIVRDRLVIELLWHFGISVRIQPYKIVIYGHRRGDGRRKDHYEGERMLQDIDLALMMHAAPTCVDVRCMAPECFFMYL